MDGWRKGRESRGHKGQVGDSGDLKEFEKRLSYPQLLRSCS